MTYLQAHAKITLYKLPWKKLYIQNKNVEKQQKQKCLIRVLRRVWFFFVTEFHMNLTFAFYHGKGVKNDTSNFVILT